MNKPLPPVFCNQTARIEEHEYLMRQARARFPGLPICPDCYHPPARCHHWRPTWTRPRR